MKKFIDSLPKEQSQYYSVNFLLAELHEIKDFAEKQKLPQNTDLVSSTYQNKAFDPYLFYKHISTVLTPEIVQNLTKIDPKI